MKYQLVIQFPENVHDELDWIADIEDKLDESLVDAEVDGHDIGSGEVNIFLNADNVANTFTVIKNILKQEEVNLEQVKIAYREFSTENYIPLWPDNLVDFTII